MPVCGRRDHRRLHCRRCCAVFRSIGWRADNPSVRIVERHTVVRCDCRFRASAALMLQRKLIPRNRNLTLNRLPRRRQSAGIKNKIASTKACARCPFFPQIHRRAAAEKVVAIRTSPATFRAPCQDPLHVARRKNPLPSGSKSLVRARSCVANQAFAISLRARARSASASSEKTAKSTRPWSLVSGSSFRSRKRTKHIGSGACLPNRGGLTGRRGSPAISPKPNSQPGNIN